MKRWLASVAATATVLHLALASDTGRNMTSRPAESAARLLDTVSLYFSGSSELRRARLASVEHLREFPNGHPARNMAGAIALLLVETPKADGGLNVGQCTAVLVRPDIVMTNAHCVLHDKKPATRATLWFEHLAVGQAVVVEAFAAPLEIDAKLDYALLKLGPLPAGASVVHLGQLPMRPAVPGERLFILHHSKGEPLQVSRAFCRAGIDQPFPGELRHTCPTQTGSSGSLVFAERDGAIVGLHRSITRRVDIVEGYATAIDDITKVSRHLAQGVAVR